MKETNRGKEKKAVRKIFTTNKRKENNAQDKKRQIGKKRSICCAKNWSKTPSELGSEETERKMLI